MKCTVLSVASLVSLLVASVAAGDFIEDVRRDFAMGLFSRQTAPPIQFFTNALGGAAASPVTKSDDTERPFEVDGDTFTDFQTAAQRSCDNQKNSCADVANSQQGGSLAVNDCDQQSTECKAAASTATTTSFATLTSSNAEFDFFCE
ncbi:hypothetical protein AB5N19_07770 [Seiridium cardinale]|uniref:Uncharacterized protein n=1 Tax=Seiridium cardinale TaxID=138064 RepID=A0ABR2Y2G1_9PEZI